MFAPRITFSGAVDYSGFANQGGLWLIISDTTDGTTIAGNPSFADRITFTNGAFLNFSAGMTDDFTRFSTGQYHSLMVGVNAGNLPTNDYDVFTGNGFSITVSGNNYTSPGEFFANSTGVLEGPVAPSAIKGLDFGSVDQPPLVLRKTFDASGASLLWEESRSPTPFPAPETGGGNGGGETNNTNLPPAAEALNVVDSAIPSDDNFGGRFSSKDDTGSFDSFSSEGDANSFDSFGSEDDTGSFDSFGPEEGDNTNTGNTENSNSNEEDKKNKDDDTNENLREQADDTASARF